MCTVTYISKDKGGFIFTSNRDEAPKRSATGLVLKKQNGKQILYPKDPQANGTWIAVSGMGQLVCILNGAFVKHKHRPPYRLSRGIMALDFFNYDSLIHFYHAFDFKGIEPFTMIVFDDGKLYEVRWDETEKYIKQKDDSKNHIWASCTLYPP